jgi:hypothetical protein
MLHVGEDSKPVIETPDFSSDTVKVPTYCSSIEPDCFICSVSRGSVSRDGFGF